MPKNVSNKTVENVKNLEMTNIENENFQQTKGHKNLKNFENINTGPK